LVFCFSDAANFILDSENRGSDCFVCPSTGHHNAGVEPCAPAVYIVSEYVCIVNGFPEKSVAQGGVGTRKTERWTCAVLGLLSQQADFFNPKQFWA